VAWFAIVDNTQRRCCAHQSNTHSKELTMSTVPETVVDEIAPDTFRISTHIPEVGPGGLTFNQFLIRDEQPFLFHTGMRGLFPLVSQAVSSLIPIESLRWISFGHVEADECGAMNHFLAAAPQAEVAHGPTACLVSLNDLADRPPRVMGDEPLEIGSHRLRFIATPHVPHNWESAVWFDETTSTLLAGDLLTHNGKVPALVETDVVDLAMQAEEIFHAVSSIETMVPTLRSLADLGPTTLALMHGSSFHGDGAGQLLDLAARSAEMAASALMSPSR
jgi:flavorubredoxin